VRAGEGSAADLQVAFHCVDAPGTYTIDRTGTSAIITYDHPSRAARALGSLLADIPAGGAQYCETTPLTTLGIMLDCSRNAVMRVEHVQRWLRRLALLGYTQVMLYTEDTYEISGEPYFGHLRGRYTGEELRTLDAYAALLGIELVGCIQTLGHLEQIFRWPAYSPICDYGGTMLVGEEAAYALIEKMLDTISANLSTRRIHIGMDEAWALGRGQYLDRHGARPRFDMLSEHLQRVAPMCEQRGLQPMIWSDMYFRIGSATHDYYDVTSTIPAEVATKIPQGVQLVYWDYYHTDEAFYREWIARHRALGSEPVVASGVWTWSQVWYNPAQTELSAGACIDACRATGVKELIFTLWGDDGGYCDFDSAFAGLAWAAERAYAHDGDLSRLPARFHALFGVEYDTIVRAGELTHPLSSPGLLWDDPLLGIAMSLTALPEGWNWAMLAERYRMLHAELSTQARQSDAGDLRHAALLADLFSRKIMLRSALVAAYDAGDRAGLTAVRNAIPAVLDVLAQLQDSFRAGWMRRNKPFGLEVLQIRLAGQQARFRELAVRLDEYLEGRVSSIPELDGRVEQPQPYGTSYRMLATASTIL
jgi:hypothetical protein